MDTKWIQTCKVHLSPSLWEVVDDKLQLRNVFHILWKLLVLLLLNTLTRWPDLSHSEFDHVAQFFKDVLQESPLHQRVYSLPLHILMDHNGGLLQCFHNMLQFVQQSQERLHGIDENIAVHLNAPTTGCHCSPCCILRRFAA
eukprot:TRINITY_DN67558_c6_g2_i4.p1 TRINITY_DN67558_c6_g2~~TRINITY_DN67558_c6_g2_i4.p1  ORF type:complete len:142 (-),score=8.62 TRINITY_DN67558_c6_g2_i4:136-561(-)